MRSNPHSIARVAVLAIATPSCQAARLTELWRRLMTELFDPYRPELHYMRGPGPKWNERHGVRR